MPPKRQFITCEICGDRVGRTNQEKRKFVAQFPLDEDRCRQWVKFVGKEDLIHVPIEKLHTLKYVCRNHFERKDFNKKNNRLKKSALPSKELKYDPLPDDVLLEFPCHIHSDHKITTEPVLEGLSDNEASISNAEVIAGPSDLELYESEACEHEAIAGPRNAESSTLKQQHLMDHDYHTEEEIISQSPKKKRTVDSGSEEVTPCKKDLIKKLHLCQRKIKILQQENVKSRIKLLALKNAIKAYIRNNKRKPQGKEWTDVEKALASAIYEQSPRTYRHLSRNGISEGKNSAKPSAMPRS